MQVYINIQCSGVNKSSLKHLNKVCLFQSIPTFNVPWKKTFENLLGEKESGENRSCLIYADLSLSLENAFRWTCSIFCDKGIKMINGYLLPCRCCFGLDVFMYVNLR